MTESDRANLKTKRILLKLSGEVLRDNEQGHSLDPKKLRSIAEQLVEARELGTEIAVVVGGGNIFRGLAGESVGISRTSGDHMGMLATVINALALQAALETIGVETRVMSAIEMPAVAEAFIRRRAIRHLEKGRIVIFAAGTGNPYFTTDSAAALRATEIDCDVLMKCTKVDGIYSADPEKDPDATRYKSLTYSEAISKQLKIMDMAAFSLCQDNRIPIVVFNFFNKGDMIGVLKGEPIGTLVHD